MSELLARLRERGWTIATAESLTGGLAASALVDVPGASACLRGGIVAYATEVKASVLGVDSGLLERTGAVDEAVAVQMAEGARRVLGAEVGIATTGVAGPEPQDGRPVGTVCIAVVTPDKASSRSLSLTGDRATIRRESVRAVLTYCAEHV